MSEISVEQHGPLWIAHIPTSYGPMELLCGEGASPDKNIPALVTRFLDGGADHIAAIRKSTFKVPIFWRPIRFAVNNEGRLSLQFKHRITGKQDGMYFTDEHSSFSVKLTDVTVTDDATSHGQ